jgi:uncharacterized protein YbaR (Trm112 family)
MDLHSPGIFLKHRFPATLEEKKGMIARTFAQDAAHRGIGRRTIACPLCQGELAVEDRLLIGEVLHCDRCKTQLEVASVEPPMLVRDARIDDELEE